MSDEARTNTKPVETSETTEGESTPKVDAKVPTFPIVGIGASSGGVEALEHFFGSMPPNPGMAFVIVQHLDPTHESILAEIVSRHSPIPAVQAEDGMAVEVDHVYVIPPNSDIELQGDQLRLTEPTQRRGFRLPIDHFFRSLADNSAERTICVILSGSGTDGTLGLKEVKGRGGVVMVQDPSTAKSTGMPQSAMATGMADFVLPPNEMPKQLVAYITRLSEVGAEPSEVVPLTTDESMRRILLLVQQRTGHDFSEYKPQTVRRRVERRMAVNQISTVDEYQQLLRGDVAETEALFRDLLISVTSFFRDPEAFEVLGEHVIPEILASLQPGEPIRVWVPGCATGEEAYSIAILIQEGVEEAGVYREVQIFATDIDPLAIEKARAGVYPDNIAADVSQERLQRNFIHDGSIFRIVSRIRDMLVFAVQSVIKDPPFSRLDLISCRNLLIYLGPQLHQKVVPLFHYALKPGGYLMLGASETPGEFVDHFSEVDRKWKVYRRPHGPSLANGLARDLLLPSVQSRIEAEAAAKRASKSVRDVTGRQLIRSFAPPAAVVNEQGEIVYIHGRTGKYLEPASGEPTHSVLHMAREGLRLPLSAALRTVAKRGQAVVQENVVVQSNGDSEVIRLTVRPMDEPSARGLLLITFEPTPPPKVLYQEVDQGEGATVVEDGRDHQIAEMSEELQTTRQQLQTTIEELEASNEELTSTNEELQSANEELQSTNEELGTSKEELQSVNEELITVNSELQVKIQELTQATADIVNLLNSISVAVIFLDHDLNVGRFNAPARSIIRLIDRDVGRPLRDLVSTLEYPDLVSDCQMVLETLAPTAKEVQDQEGNTYWMRIQLLSTDHQTIEGVILTFSDITEQKLLQAELEAERNNLQERVERRTKELRDTIATLQASEQKYQALVENTPDLIVRFDRALRCIYVNPAVVRATGTSYDAYVGRRNRELDMADDVSALWDRTIDEVFRTGEDRSIQFEYVTTAGPRHLQAHLVPERGADGEVASVLSVARDVTEVERATRALEASELRFRTTVENLPAGAAYREGDVLKVNEALEAMTGYTRDELRTVTAWNEKLMVCDDEDALSCEFWDVTGDDGVRTTQVTTASGERRWFTHAGAQVSDDADVWVIYDATAERESGEALTLALREKETLLRELYHRTKNNMQVISAIMELQSANVTDEEALKAFQETQSRISAIALVHRRLYESDSLADLDLGAYMGDLVDLLVATYATEQAKIEVVKDLDTVAVPIDVATPCGLLLNELVSNALKHGLAGKRRGRIEVGVEHTSDGEIVLTVADNGVGVPEDFDFRKTVTLGVQAVIQIAERQLLGHVAFEGGPGRGVRCQVAFPDNLYRHGDEV